MNDTLAKTLCNRDCPDACGIVASVRDGRVVKLAGDPDHPVTRGFLCYRTNQFLRRQYSPERLTAPLLRKGGVLVAVEWNEVLDHIAENLLRIRRESGPAAIFHYRSGGSLGLLKVLSDYFFELFGPVTIKRGDICSGAGEAAQALDFGVSDSSALSLLGDSRHIVLWGKNVHTSNPHVIPIIKEAQARGAGVPEIGAPGPSRDGQLNWVIAGIDPHRSVPDIDERTDIAGFQLIDPDSLHNGRCNLLLIERHLHHADMGGIEQPIDMIL